MPVVPLGLVSVVEAPGKAGREVMLLDLMFKTDSEAVLNDIGWLRKRIQVRFQA